MKRKLFNTINIVIFLGFMFLASYGCQQFLPDNINPVYRDTVYTQVPIYLDTCKIERINIYINVATTDSDVYINISSKDTNVFRYINVKGTIRQLK